MKLCRFEKRVFIKELELHGRVVAIYYLETGVQYSVRYFDNFEARTVNFFEDELEVINDK